MNELIEYKKSVLIYPKTTIKEMEKLLKNSQKEEFIIAHMHVIYRLSKLIYQKYPEYFKTNSIIDVIQEGNEITVKAYNRGIREYRFFSYIIYLEFYLNTLEKIKKETGLKQIVYKDVIEDEDTIIEYLDRKIFSEKIKKSINELGELRTQIYKERYEYELSLRQIAKLHNISHESIRTHENKIKNHIKNIIKSK